MSYYLNWTPDAELTFNQNIEYLEHEWNDIVINQFLDRVNTVLNAIRKNPFLFSLESKKVRKCVINKRIILYYTIAGETRIDILLFWNTYQNPEKLKF